MAVTEKQITDLEGFFKKAKQPGSIQLDEGTKILDVPTFIESHLKVLRSNLDKPIYIVFYTRLLQLREQMTEKTN